jgi:pyruvate/2-oxoglutarate dehydrogenase complex dihydrolipoamide dehydrogenase (E3) component
MKASALVADLVTEFKTQGRIVIVGAGFIGSEMASVCRELGLAVTVAERAEAPLVGALGGVIGEIAAQMQRDAGVDLRTVVSVGGPVKLTLV